MHEAQNKKRKSIPRRGTELKKQDTPSQRESELALGKSAAGQDCGALPGQQGMQSTTQTGTAGASDWENRKAAVCDPSWGTIRSGSARSSSALAQPCVNAEDTKGSKDCKSGLGCAG